MNVDLIDSNIKSSYIFISRPLELSPAVWTTKPTPNTCLIIHSMRHA